jgi:hypothetical protein
MGIHHSLLSGLSATLSAEHKNIDSFCHVIELHILLCWYWRSVFAASNNNCYLPKSIPQRMLKQVELNRREGDNEIALSPELSHLSLLVISSPSPNR